MGTAIFSCLSIFANNLGVLIFLRIANGMFAAGIMPISMALVGERFDEDYRQSALAKVMAMMFLGGLRLRSSQERYRIKVPGGKSTFFMDWLK